MNGIGLAAHVTFINFGIVISSGNPMFGFSVDSYGITVHIYRIAFLNGNCQSTFGNKYRVFSSPNFGIMTFDYAVIDGISNFYVVGG